MEALDRLWLRLPVIGRAVLIGLGVAAAGTVPWTALVSANTRHYSTLPWAVPLMAMYLWVYWRYFVRGTGWPRSMADTRRLSARANPLPPEAWGPALLAGMLGLAGVLLLQGVLSRLVALPQQQDLDVSRYPVLTVLAWVLMSAVVVGVVEETSFRGYLQRPVERRHGPAIAVLVSGSVFGVTHFTHPEVGIVLGWRCLAGSPTSRCRRIEQGDHRDSLESSRRLDIPVNRGCGDRQGHSR